MRTLFIYLFFAITTLPVFAQIPSYVPSLGLKAWWSFNGNANDLSGNNINGTVNGAVLTTDRNNNSNSAYLFDGLNDWIDFGDNDSLNPHFSDITVSAWVKTTSSYSRIYSKGTHGGSQPGYAIMIYPGAGGKAALIFSPGGHEHNLDRSNSPINNDLWHMVTGVLNRNGNTALYIDGALQTLTTNINHDAGVDVAANTYNATVGASYCSYGIPNSLSEFFAGKIDEVGVWRRALTQCEIIQLYNESLFPMITVNSGSICSGNSFTMIPTGAVTYTFEGGNAVVSPTANTSYTVIGTNTAGCVPSGFATSNVTVNALPTIVVNSGSICSGNSFTMIPGGANTYTFSGGNAVVSPTANTSYSVTGTSTEGCISATAAVSDVTVNALPIITVNSGSICSGNSFTMVPSGANTYTFSGGNAVVSPTVNTSYSVTGTSTDGCVSATAAVSDVTVNALPIITVNSGSICSGQSFTMIPSGANTYTFSGGNAVVSPTANTSYSVIGTSTDGCVSATAAVSDVTVNALPTVIANTSNSIICGPPFQGTATLTGSGASTYAWNPGGTGTSIVVSPSVTSQYTLTGADANGCSNSTVFTQSVSTCTGLNQISNSASEINIYPNPFNNKITIVSNGIKQTVQIFNALGSLVHNTTIENEKTEIDLINQQSGIYFIRISSVTKKVIKE